MPSLPTMGLGVSQYVMRYISAKSYETAGVFLKIEFQKRICNREYVTVWYFPERYGYWNSDVMHTCEILHLLRKVDGRLLADQGYLRDQSLPPWYSTWLASLSWFGWFLVSFD